MSNKTTTNQSKKLKLIIHNIIVLIKSKWNQKNIKLYESYEGLCLIKKSFKRKRGFKKWEGDVFVILKPSKRVDKGY